MEQKDGKINGNKYEYIYRARVVVLSYFDIILYFGVKSFARIYIKNNEKIVVKTQHISIAPYISNILLYNMVRVARLL